MRKREFKYIVVLTDENFEEIINPSRGMAGKEWFIIAWHDQCVYCLLNKILYDSFARKQLRCIFCSFISQIKSIYSNSSWNFWPSSLIFVSQGGISTFPNSERGDAFLYLKSLCFSKSLTLERIDLLTMN